MIDLQQLLMWEMEYLPAQHAIQDGDGHLVGMNLFSPAGVEEGKAEVSRTSGFRMAALPYQEGAIARGCWIVLWCVSG